MDEVLAEAAARAIAYRRTVDARGVFPDEAAVLGLNEFVEALPDEPAAAAEVIAQLGEVGAPATVASTGGRYFGFVTGGVHPAGLAASWMSAAWDQNAAMGVMSPVAAVLDTVAGGWLTELFGLPASSQHSFVSGTSAANNMCLAIARDRLLHDMGWDSVQNGLRGSPEVRVVVSSAAHSSVTKALSYVGIGRDAVVSVTSDDQGRIDVKSLPAAGAPTLVVLQAGNVNSGACDGFDAVADHFEGSPSWIHVDGAFGLWAAASPSTRHLAAGMNRADSWATDMHKWLNTTYDSAVAVVRDPADMARTFQVGAPYLPGSSRLEPVQRAPDMSQRARGIETWAVLKSLGRSGVSDLIDRCCAHARRFAEELAAAGFTVHNDVVLNQVLVSLDSDEATQALINAVHTDGTLWAGASVWADRTVMRISVSGEATTDVDVGESIASLVALSSLLDS
ncbi:MAG: pyridoxal phosphate-dependent decarboxylase family protein [Acidimicrobiales bacterium]